MDFDPDSGLSYARQHRGEAPARFSGACDRAGSVGGEEASDSSLGFLLSPVLLCRHLSVDATASSFAPNRWWAPTHPSLSSFPSLWDFVSGRSGFSSSLEGSSGELDVAPGRGPGPPVSDDSLGSLSSGEIRF